MKILSLILFKSFTIKKENQLLVKKKKMLTFLVLLTLQNNI